jgi:hypothetical protein
MPVAIVCLRLTADRGRLVAMVGMGPGRVSQVSTAEGPPVWETAEARKRLRASVAARRRRRVDWLNAGVRGQGNEKRRSVRRVSRLNAGYVQVRSAGGIGFHWMPRQYDHT